MQIKSITNQQKLEKILLSVLASADTVHSHSIGGRRTLKSRYGKWVSDLGFVFKDYRNLPIVYLCSGDDIIPDPRDDFEVLFAGDYGKAEAVALGWQAANRFIEEMEL